MFPSLTLSSAMHVAASATRMATVEFSRPPSDALSTASLICSSSSPMRRSTLQRRHQHVVDVLNVLVRIALQLVFDRVDPRVAELLREPHDGRKIIGLGLEDLHV